MKSAPLGKSPFRVGRIGLGTMMFGSDRLPDGTAYAILDDALAAGVNLIDTADVYNEGRAEQIIGKWARANPAARAQVVVHTKIGNPTGPGRNDSGLSGVYVRRAVVASLSRLGYADAVYLHKDRGGDLREPLSALAPFLRAGDIGGWALSNFSSWRALEAVRVAHDLGLPDPVALQLCYSAADRAAENELIPFATAYGIGVVAYSVLARGVLTGKYGADLATVPADSRAADPSHHGERLRDAEFHIETGRLAADLVAFGDRAGFTATALTVAWALRNRGVAAVLAGPRERGQFAPYLDALHVPDAVLDVVESIVDRHTVPGGRTSVRWSDPMHKPAGRVLR